jgi:cytochrome c551/c552
VDGFFPHSGLRRTAPARDWHDIRMRAPVLLLSALPALPAADPPAQVFQIQCAACHQVDQMVVGPSLVEIAGIYKNDPDGFVKWCIAPQHKREGVIEMPSMAHLGEPVLRQLHGYILEAAAGKTERKKADGDPFGVPAAGAADVPARCLARGDRGGAARRSFVLLRCRRVPPALRVEGRLHRRLGLLEGQRQLVGEDRR